MKLLMPSLEPAAEVKERACGECSLCCKVMGIEDEKLTKPPNQWCHLVQIGKNGCGIYDHRPEPCRKFACLWQQGNLPEEYTPRKLHAVLWLAEDTDLVTVSVDMAYPDAATQEPLKSLIDRVLQHFNVCIITGDKRRLMFNIERQADANKNS